MLLGLWFLLIKIVDVANALLLLSPFAKHIHMTMFNHYGGPSSLIASAVLNETSCSLQLQLSIVHM